MIKLCKIPTWGEVRTRLPTKFVKYRKFQTKFRYIYSENNVPLTALKMQENASQSTYI